jgi:hypothetical protein
MALMDMFIGGRGGVAAMISDLVQYKALRFILFVTGFFGVILLYPYWKK